MDITHLIEFKFQRETLNNLHLLSGEELHIQKGVDRVRASGSLGCVLISRLASDWRKMFLGILLPVQYFVSSQLIIVKYICLKINDGISKLADYATLSIDMI